MHCEGTNQMFRPIFAAALGTAMLAGLPAAQAHKVAVQYVCGPVPPSATVILPAPDWGPFFHRHVYRYGPIGVCNAVPVVLDATKVISVKY